MEGSFGSLRKDRILVINPKINRDKRELEDLENMQITGLSLSISRRIVHRLPQSDKWVDMRQRRL